MSVYVLAKLANQVRPTMRLTPPNTGNYDASNHGHHDHDNDEDSGSELDYPNYEDHDGAPQREGGDDGNIIVDTAPCTSPRSRLRADGNGAVPEPILRRSRRARKPHVKSFPIRPNEGNGDWNCMVLNMYTQRQFVPVVILS